MLVMGQVSLGFLAEKPPNQALPHGGLPSSGFFFSSFFFLNLKELLFNFWANPLLSVTWSQANQLGKQKSCKSCKTAKVWTKPWVKNGVLAMQLGGPHGTWGLHQVLRNLTHFWAQISSLQDQAPLLPPVTSPDFSKAMWCCFKTLPSGKLKDKYWRMDTNVHLSHENWCLLRKF